MINTELTQAYKIRHALDEKILDFPDKIAERLAFSRDIALSRKKTEIETVTVASVIVAGQSHSSTRDTSFAWLKRLSLTIPFLVIAFGLIGIYQYEQRQQIAETAYLDAQVLDDELPVSAYLDKGFNAYLMTKSENK